MFRSVLIANRGEIACRIARTAKRLGLRTIAVYSTADADALHVRSCDEAHCIGGAEPRDSYLSIESLITVRRSRPAPNASIRVMASCPRTPILPRLAKKPASSSSVRPLQPSAPWD